MEIKETEELLVVTYIVKKTSHESRNVIDLFWKEIQETKGNAKKPLYLIYKGLDCDSKTEMNFSVKIGVKKKEISTKGVLVETLKPLKCVSLFYEGDLSFITSKGYNRLLLDIESRGIRVKNEWREVYHYYKGFHSSENLTEIQIAIV